MMWYSNQNIFNGVYFGDAYNISTKLATKGTDIKRFNQTVGNFLMKLAYQAASGDFRRKFATGEVDVTGKLKVYAMVQCTPNLEEYDCFDCLRIVINYTVANCCYGDQGVRVGVPSCNIRYENYRFYGSASVLPPLRPLPFSPAPTGPPSSQTIIAHTRGRRRKRSRVLIIILVPALISLILFLTGFYLMSRRKALKKSKNEDGNEEETSQMVQSWQMNFATISAATNNFSEANKLGQGGFGTVYKGTLSTGQEIAVKRLSKTSGQGEKDFKKEALLVAKLQHRNLVKFLGFCLEKDERLLIYEYLPNKSLDSFLYDPTKSVYLNWQRRYKIIEGIARGLLYLHEESRLLVVHRDLKASNVLLDAEMNPKISDFGMARLFGADQSHANTSKIAGTYGYMAPEYVLHGQFSIKSDVYSFGVLVLEIVSGQKVSKFSEAENGESLLSFAWKNWSEGNALKLVDSRLSNVNTTEVLRCINIGLSCVQDNATQRPIMSSVVLMLNSYSVTLPVPSRPAFQVQNDMDKNASPFELKGRPLDGSINDVSVSMLEPR